MRLDEIAAYTLTFNEEENIRQCLEALRWAKDVVVVDSFSDDRTLEIVAAFPNARVVQRVFDSHSNQHRFALEQIPHSKWVLRLDADWVLTKEFMAEVGRLEIPPSLGGLRVSFVFSIYGEIVPISLYPPVVALFRREGAAYAQDGHTERLVPSGDVMNAKSRIIHEDNKPLRRFLLAQIKYGELEAAKIDGPSAEQTGWKGKLRKVPGLGALSVATYLLFVRGGIFRGRASWHYVLQRLVAELIISLTILDQRIRRDNITKKER